VSSTPLGRRGERFLTAARELNRNEALVQRVRELRTRALGDELPAGLSSARARPAEQAARQLVALRGETPGVLGELGMSALQAWQLLAERQGRGRGELEVAILFTDLVGFSEWALDAGDRAALVLLRALGEAIEPPIRERRGEIVKRLGDGLMAACRDAPSALAAAFEGHARAAELEVEGYRPALRTGIHLGRPRRIAGDYLGVDVNIAARIAQAAQPGEILISARMLSGLEDCRAAASPPRELRAKGVPEGFRVYAVSRRGRRAPARSSSPP
jgi:class 3 adenylate cyclase